MLWLCSTSSQSAHGATIHRKANLARNRTTALSGSSCFLYRFGLAPLQCSFRAYHIVAARLAEPFWSRPEALSGPYRDDGTDQDTPSAAYYPLTIRNFQLLVPATP